MKKTINILLVGMVALILSACGKDGGGRAVGPYYGQNGYVSGSAQDTINALSYYSPSFISASGDMNSIARDLLFPNGAQATFEMGQVSSMGVVLDLTGYGQQMGQMLTQQSLQQYMAQAQMLLVFQDTYSQSGQQPPIYVAMPKGSLRTATLNGNNLILEFGDNYGIIRLNGTYNQGSGFYGRIGYQNSGQSYREMGSVNIYM